jgi:hypothetical protein
METVPEEDMEALRAAETWVRDPVPEHRQAAADAAARANQDSAAAWTAHAAAWSGGILAIGRATPIAPPPELTPHAASVAIALAGRFLPPEERARRLKVCIEEGEALAVNGL